MIIETNGRTNIYSVARGFLTKPMLSSDTTLYLEYLLYSNRKITGGQMNRRSWIYYRLSTANLVATTLLGLAIWLVGAVTEDSVGEIIYMVMILVSMFLMLVNIYLTRTK